MYDRLNFPGRNLTIAKSYPSIGTTAIQPKISRIKMFDHVKLLNPVPTRCQSTVLKKLVRACTTKIMTEITKTIFIGRAYLTHHDDNRLYRDSIVSSSIEC